MANKQNLSGIKVVDADTHLTEAPDLWTSRAPAAWRERVPQLRVIDGVNKWAIDGVPMRLNAQASSVVHKDGHKGPCVDAMTMTIEQAHPACYEAGARVAMMDKAGIWAQIAYPNILGFGGQRSPTNDPELKLMCIEIFNDAMAEFQERSGNRIFPMALIPWWDIDAAVKEVRRVKALGLRGVNTNSDPQDQNLPDLGEAHWYPLWETCSELGLPVNFHIGASDTSSSWFGTATWPSLNTNQKVALGSAMLFLGNARVLGNLIYTGVPERFPDLKFVSVESGVGWIPFVLEMLDYQANETALGSMSALTLRPSEYFKRQFYGCFWFEKRNFARSLEALGTDNLLFETDFPHPTCLYPNAMEHAAEALHDVDLETCRKVLGGNAAKLYSLPI